MVDRIVLNAMLEAHQKLVSENFELFTRGSSKMTIPVFPRNDVIALCQRAAIAFQAEPVLLNLQGPIHVVRDLHGHLLDLLRIVYNHGFPPATKYLFLGDLVDRGEFSLETTTFIFLMKVIWPTSVHLIRGNHEFEAICASHGFANEISQRYIDRSVFEAFTAAFSVLPLAAKIGDHILCVHGGLGPDLVTVSQIQTIKRPMPSLYGGVPEALLWSDPSLDISGFGLSKRGSGHFFGLTAFKRFMEANKLRFLIRAHECVEGGIESIFGNSLLTVFSASNYCGNSNNRAGVLFVSAKNEFKKILYEPLPYLRRSDAVFSVVATGPDAVVEQSMMSAVSLTGVTPVNVKPSTVKSSMTAPGEIKSAISFLPKVCRNVQMKYRRNEIGRSSEKAEVQWYGPMDTRSLLMQ